MHKRDFLKSKYIKFNSRFSVIQDGKPVDHPFILGGMYLLINSVEAHTIGYYHIRDHDGGTWVAKVDLNVAR